MRKLATVQVIEQLTPIDGADKIVRATMVGLGWECVVKKDEFKVGEYVIYCEIDSVLPDKPEFEFLRDKKFRIRTIKLRNQISQGLILPVSYISNKKVNIGDDVTEIIGIKKYLTTTEAEETKVKVEKNKIKKFLMRYSFFRKILLKKNKKEEFPPWVIKTDEERLQNMPSVLKKYYDKEVYITEKIDYQSATFTGMIVNKYKGILGKIFPIKKYNFIVCSRNLVNNDKNSLYYKIAKKYNIENILKQNPTLIIQGEQGNTKVQGNKYSIKEESLWVFNIIDYSKGYHYNYDEMLEFCNKNGLVAVPLLKKCKLSDIGSTVEDFIKYSKGNSVICKEQLREGVVVRCVEYGKKVFSFKVINPEFLLKFSD